MIKVKIDHTTNKINDMCEANEVIQGKLKAGLYEAQEKPSTRHWAIFI